MFPPELALLAWLPIALALFSLLRAEYALCGSLIGGFLLLPQRYSFDTPGLPPVGKVELTCLATLLAAGVIRGRELLMARPGRGAELLALLTALGTLGTTAVNQEPIAAAPGLSWGDALGPAFSDVATLAVPFFLGRAFHLSPAALARTWIAVVVLALAYAPLVVYELVMSPQLHRIVYGYFQHDFFQVIRYGGWRPMVFMHHGLSLALFLAIATIGATTLAGLRVRILGAPAYASAAALAALLLWCKSVAALLWGCLGAIPMLLASPRQQRVVAWALALALAAYMPLRLVGLFPIESLLGAAGAIDQDRRSSLEVRLANESYLLQHALQKPWFGWGEFGRSMAAAVPEDWRVVNDGYWIIRFGQRGAVGFAGFLALVLLPIWQARRVLRKPLPAGTQRLLTGTALALGVCIGDTIPNGLFNPIAVFLAGCLSGTATALQRVPGLAKPPAPTITPHARIEPPRVRAATGTGASSGGSTSGRGGGSSQPRAPA